MIAALEWKQFYRSERVELGAHGLLELLETSPAATMADDGALVIPHTRLQVTGHQIASAVNAVIASGADRVLALGVLHGGMRRDAELVSAARSGETSAVAALRGVHDEATRAGEEFSLDAFTEMIGLAAQRAGRSIEVIRRYPFLVGDDPQSLPGMDELRAIVKDGCALVATTDPMHHGIGYGLDPAECRDEHDQETLLWTTNAIDGELAALSAHRFADFQQLTVADQSDFRDTGPVLALLLDHGFTWSIDDVDLVDYSKTLSTPAPTWVAGALITTKRA